MAHRALSSTSTAASPIRNDGYQVFINHRGPDVKKTLASHLYHRLSSAEKLTVFLDKPELRVGENFPSQIKEAIRSASVHVAIFSPRYAESEWCLKELLYMLESGAPIIPVFYHVDPADLRWTQSEHRVYSKGLRKLEEKLRHDSTTIQKWRDALSTVANISGLDLQATCNGDEGELVEKIVRRVLEKVKRPALSHMSHMTRYPVGLNEEIENFEKKVVKNQQGGKVQVVGIVGMGGAGKTTLAVELFNRKGLNYDKSCFLHEVRAGKSSLPSLQRKLLKGLTQSDLRLDNIYEGKAMLTEHLSSSDSKFIVLDDVDDRNQVDALLPNLESVLSSSSFVLITGRDTDVLTRSGVEKSSIYCLNGLNPQYSLELFCLHAFNQPYAYPEFKDPVNKFLTACGGLPLSLEVFGALLYGENDITFWDAHLDRLRKMLPSHIQEKLQISYDALDREDKQIFLDIACFFVGENRDMVIRIWEGSGWNGLLGLRNLQNRCLVQVDTENRIKMHDHLRDLGKTIAQNSGSRHCLLPPVKNIDELLQQTSVGAEVRGIRMRPSEYKDNDENKDSDTDDDYASFPCYKNSKLELLDIEDGILERILRRVHAPNLIWLRWEKCPCSSLPSWIIMKNLRALEVQGNELETLWQSASQVPSQLRELKIRDAPLSKFPESIGKLKHLEQIYVNLRTGKINVKALPEEFCNLRSLKTLELLNFSNMKSLPELFGNLTNLRHIDLTKCLKLEKLPNSFGNLTRLKYLKLYFCSNLTISHETLGNIRTLEYINLSYCTKIEEMPPQITLQRSLEKLYCVNTSLKELPSTIGVLTKLEVLFLGSTSLKALPDSLGNLMNLKQLMLLGCNRLNCLPDSVGLLTQLIELRLDCPIRELPFKREGDHTVDNLMFPQLQRIVLLNAEVSEVAFGQGVCSNLQYLMLSHCNALTKVGTLPNTLIKLELYFCQRLRCIEIGLCGLAKLEVLYITDSPYLESIWGLEKLPKLRVVALLSRRLDHIRTLPNIKDLRLLEKLMVPGCAMESIQGLERLTELRVLDVSACFNLKEMPGVEYLRSLETLKASDCGMLKRIQVSHQQTKLRELDVTRCSDLEELQGVENLSSLEELKASFCRRLKSIRVSDQLTKLQELDVSGCSNLEALPGVEHLSSLKELKASGCRNLKSIQVSKQLTDVRELDVSNCFELEELPDVEYLSSLEKLKASGCRKWTRIQGLEKLTKLRELDVTNCRALEALQGVGHLRSLEKLMASGCRRLKSIRMFEELTELRELDVSECFDLEELPGIELLRSLEKFDAYCCDKLKDIPLWAERKKCRTLSELREGSFVPLSEVSGARFSGARFPGAGITGALKLALKRALKLALKGLLKRLLKRLKRVISDSKSDSELHEELRILSELPFDSDTKSELHEVLRILSELQLSKASGAGISESESELHEELRRLSELHEELSKVSGALSKVSGAELHELHEGLRILSTLQLSKASGAGISELHGELYMSHEELLRLFEELSLSYMRSFLSFHEKLKLSKVSGAGIPGLGQHEEWRLRFMSHVLPEELS